MTPRMAPVPHPGTGTDKQPLPPSFLYVPGNKPALFPKALSSPAGAVVLDLEDSVPAAEKAPAREHVAEFLGDHPRKPVWVRINALDHQEEAEADLALANLGQAAGIFVPKLELGGLAWVMSRLNAADSLMNVALIGLIESAKGLLEAPELARAGIRALGIGRVDLFADLRVELSEETEGIFEVYASQVVLASVAAGIQAPIAPVMLDLKDMRSTRTTDRYRRLGFRSRTALHPGQCEAINTAFAPAREQYLEAKELLEEFGQGEGVLVTKAGGFVDEAVIRHAREVVTRYEAATANPETGEGT